LYLESRSHIFQSHSIIFHLHFSLHFSFSQLLDVSLSNSHSLSEKCPWKIECFLEDLFLGSQGSIILGYRRLSVKSLTLDWEQINERIPLAHRRLLLTSRITVDVQSAAKGVFVHSSIPCSKVIRIEEGTLTTLTLCPRT